MHPRSFRHHVVDSAIALSSMVIYGCSATATGNADEVRGESASALNSGSWCPPFQHLVCDTEDVNDDNWDNIHHKNVTTTTTCSCVPYLGPNPATCGSTVAQCGATLAVPPELPGCTFGTNILPSVSTTTPINVWLCPATYATSLPPHITAPCPSDGCDQIGMTEHVVVHDGPTICTSCGGEAPSDHVFVIQYYAPKSSVVVDPGGCRGGCGMDP